MSDADLLRFKEGAHRMEPGVAACLELQRVLGLREKEAVMSVASLSDWKRQLSVGGAINVLHGTKGGRARATPPTDRERAIAAVSAALTLAKTQGGWLIPRDSLEAALNRYSYVCQRIGMVGELASHSLRYAYAGEHLSALLRAGVSEREARAAVSMYLGHGDGRGRWVAMVYARGTIEC